MFIRASKLLLVLLALFPVSTLEAAENPLKPFRAEYTLHQDDEVIAITKISLTNIGENLWRYRNASEPTGWLGTILGIKVIQESEWSWNDHIRPSRYRYDRSGKEKHVHMQFDWQNMKVTNVINGDPWQMEIPEGTQDKLSINLALMAHLAQSETDISFPVADGGRLKTYDFKIVGREHINTPLGQINTIRISRNKRGRKDRQAILWLSPELGYLPVRIEKADSDDEIATLNIQSLE